MGRGSQTHSGRRTLHSDGFFERDAPSVPSAPSAHHGRRIRKSTSVTQPKPGKGYVTESDCGAFLPPTLPVELRRNKVRPPHVPSSREFPVTKLALILHVMTRTISLFAVIVAVSSRKGALAH